MEGVYSFLKIFKFKDRLDAVEKGEVPPPIHIRLKPMNPCNHRCFYCCYRNENLFLSELMNPKDMIPWEKMKEIIEDVSEMGVKAITFSGGGEPLIYPYIVDAVRMITDRGIKVATLTNGANLSDDIAEIFAERATWVRISIDAADEETYSRTRNVSRDEFNKVLKNIENFARIKNDCELGINYIVTKLNYKDTYRFIKLMKDLGADHVKVSECVVSTSGAENNEYHKDHFWEVKEQLARAKEDFDDGKFLVVDKFHDFPEKFDKKYTWCPYLNFLTVIAADLNVYTCQDKAYTTSGLLGSIKNRRFIDFWFSEENKRKIKNLNPSVDCPHHCATHGKNLLLLEYFNIKREHMEFV